MFAQLPDELIWIILKELPLNSIETVTKLDKRLWDIGLDMYMRRCKGKCNDYIEFIAEKSRTMEEKNELLR